MPTNTPNFAIPVPAGGDQPTVAADLLAAFTQVDRFLCPPGSIIAFHGTAVPAGWAICDGTNGTPNLVGRFIRARATPATVGNAAGAAQVTLTTAHMPEHNHGGTTGDDTPDHAHSAVGAFSVVVDPGGSNGVAAYSGMVTGGASNRHTHPISKQGGGQPVSILPPYYELVYLMKLP